LKSVPDDGIVVVATRRSRKRKNRNAMPDVGERLDNVEQGLTNLSQSMDEQFVKVDERFAQVDQRFNQLQMLGEDNASNIKLVAEVLAHHGTVLDQIKEGVEPLKTLQPLFEKVAKDHEQRITALERARQ
jgi:DNA repair ATPase RecN